MREAVSVAFVLTLYSDLLCKMPRARQAGTHVAERKFRAFSRRHELRDALSRKQRRILHATQKLKPYSAREFASMSSGSFPVSTPSRSGILSKSGGIQATERHRSKRMV